MQKCKQKNGYNHIVFYHRPSLTFALFDVPDDKADRQRGRWINGFGPWIHFLSTRIPAINILKILVDFPESSNLSTGINLSWTGSGWHCNQFFTMFLSDVFSNENCEWMSMKWWIVSSEFQPNKKSVLILDNKQTVLKTKKILKNYKWNWNTNWEISELKTKIFSYLSLKRSSYHQLFSTIDNLCYIFKKTYQ